MDDHGAEIVSELQTIASEVSSVVSELDEFTGVNKRLDRMIELLEEIRDRLA